MTRKGQFAKPETQFRDILLKFGVYTESSIPDRLTTEKVQTVAHSLDAEKTKEKYASKKKEKEVAQPVSKIVCWKALTMLSN